MCSCWWTCYDIEMVKSPYNCFISPLSQPQVDNQQRKIYNSLLLSRCYYIVSICTWWFHQFWKNLEPSLILQENKVTWINSAAVSCSPNGAWVGGVGFGSGVVSNIIFCVLFVSFLYCGTLYQLHTTFYFWRHRY